MPIVNTAANATPSVELLWIPLGSGQRVVKFSGKLFETISALFQRRAACDIYHAALTITVPEGRYAIEMAPIPDRHGEQRGVVAEGPVGLKVLGRFRIFRYEIRRWCRGIIPDANEAVTTVTVSTDQSCAQQLLNLLPTVPTPVWGRDELRAGEMWNSNSVIAWLLARGYLDVARLRPPAGGRAPGWSSGLVIAKRDPNPNLKPGPAANQIAETSSTTSRRTDIDFKSHPLGPPSPICCHER